MSDMLKTLAIEVESYVDVQTIEEMERLAAEAREKKMWIIILLVILAAELVFALVFPKYHKRFQAQREEKERIRAERKRIQSKRK